MAFSASSQVEEMNSRLATAQGAQKETTRRVPWPADFVGLLGRSDPPLGCFFAWFSGWWFGTWRLFSHILGMSSSQLTFIFFRGVAQNHQAVNEYLNYNHKSTLQKYTQILWRHQGNDASFYGSLWYHWTLLWMSARPPAGWFFGEASFSSSLT